VNGVVLEWTAALCSVLGVWLMARRRLSAWPVGLLSVTLYGLVFAEAKLYSDTLLQVAFGGFLVYGWLNWRQHAADEGSIRIVPLARGKLLRDLAFGLCGGVALGAAMHTFTDRGGRGLCGCVPVQVAACDCRAVRVLPRPGRVRPARMERGRARTAGGAGSLMRMAGLCAGHPQ
jgi:nicotinamide riboside transporter PnuC